MPFFVTPNVIAIVIITVLLVSGFIAFLRRIGGTHRGGNGFVIFKLSEDINNIDKVINAIQLPFVFEVAVDQLGRELSYYVAVSAKHSKRVINELGASEVSDYEFYHPQGVHIGAYLKGGVDVVGMDISKIDFSSVNEVGESVVVQFVFHKKTGSGIETNIRVLTSAQSSYQAKEIMSRIKSSMSSVKLIDVNSADFITRFNLRKFESKESVTLIV